jgi:ribose/xylose/arabinose/galactoside ABC-type transport system permease subunit
VNFICTLRELAALLAGVLLLLAGLLLPAALLLAGLLPRVLVLLTWIVLAWILVLLARVLVLTHSEFSLSLFAVGVNERGRDWLRRNGGSKRPFIRHIAQR